MGRTIVKMLSGLTRLRRSRCAPDELLLLLPSCLQNSECTARVTKDIQECRRCGNCKMKDLIELAERHGVRCAVATGGRLALELAQQDGVKAVVAVACEKELQAGLAAVFPKPAVGIINLRPNGPCTDTDVELEKVEEAIAWFLRD